MVLPPFKSLLVFPSSRNYFQTCSYLFDPYNCFDNYVPVFPKIFCLCSPVPHFKLAKLPCSPKPLGGPQNRGNGLISKKNSNEGQSNTTGNDVKIHFDEYNAISWSRDAEKVPSPNTCLIKGQILQSQTAEDVCFNNNPLEAFDSIALP